MLSRARAPKRNFCYLLNCKRGKRKRVPPKETKSLSHHKEEGQTDEKTGRHLSYKQEMSKIINEYLNGKTQAIQGIFGYFLSL